MVSVPMKYSQAPSPAAAPGMDKGSGMQQEIAAAAREAAPRGKPLRRCPHYITDIPATEPASPRRALLGSPSRTRRLPVGRAAEPAGPFHLPLRSEQREDSAGAQGAAGPQRQESGGQRAASQEPAGEGSAAVRSFGALSLRARLLDVGVRQGLPLPPPHTRAHAHTHTRTRATLCRQGSAASKVTDAPLAPAGFSSRALLGPGPGLARALPSLPARLRRAALLPMPPS